MQDENQSTSRIWSFFNCHEVMFMHILHAAYNLSRIKENEHKNIKHSFKNTFFHWFFSEWQDDDW